MPGACNLQGEVEGAGLGWSGGEETERPPNSSLITVVTGEVTRSDRHRLWLERFRLDIRKILFCRRVVQPQQGSKEVVESPSMEVFEAWIDKAMAKLI